jgi:hypothetical protein
MSTSFLFLFLSLFLSLFLPLFLFPRTLQVPP